MPTTRHISGRHPFALAAAVSAFVPLAMAGCASGAPAAPPAPPPVAAPAAAIDCRTEGTWMLLPDAPATPDPSIPVPGRVPDGFEASAALRCSVDWIRVEEPTSGGRAYVQVERLEGDLAPLLAALAEPDDPVPADLACTADMEIVSPLWLEGSDGTLIPVRYPRDACGKTKPGTHDALDRLEVVSVQDVPVPADN
ncbi:hypothetical protein ACFWN7_12060 [Agromyces sp. NPDC058484]|uniref:hypothetical protein n=1 Tax=Agromyces sp. NPDC058484 TaxID=3346524 RepID=UPI00365200BA